MCYFSAEWLTSLPDTIVGFSLVASFVCDWAESKSVLHGQVSWMTGASSSSLWFSGQLAWFSAQTGHRPGSKPNQITGW